MKIVRNIRGDGHCRSLAKEPDDCRNLSLHLNVCKRGKGTFFPDTINLLAFTCIVYEWASQRHLPLSFFLFICALPLETEENDGIWNEQERVFEILGILNILRQNMKRNANGFSICRNGKEHLSYYMMRKKQKLWLLSRMVHVLFIRIRHFIWA